MIGSNTSNSDSSDWSTPNINLENAFLNDLNKTNYKEEDEQEEPNCSVDDLQNALKECEVIVETNSLEVFLTDSILQCLKLVEGGSTLTRFDITGLSDNLKKNEQFHKLCKQLYVKYSVFSKIPAEYSLMMVIATTAYACTIVNQRKRELNRFLDEPINSAD